MDLRVSESSRKGELIAGTKLGQLATIALAVDFSYRHPVLNGEMLSAQLILKKRNGDFLTEDASCYRYLKGE